MGIAFKGKHPVWGRGERSSATGNQEQSHYYYWWEFLRRNKAYAACCAAGGVGEMEKLYADFGDVLNVTFKQWWLERGYKLFAEKPKALKLGELNSPSDWDLNWTKEQVMVVAVPLDLPKRYLQGFFARLLKERHPTKKPGRRSLRIEGATTAEYKLYRNVSVKTLKTQLLVYDEVMAKQRGEHKRNLAQIGKKLGLVPKTNKRTAIDPEVMDDNKRRAVLAATVSRHFRDACRIVVNTAKGQFPNSDD